MDGSDNKLHRLWAEGRTALNGWVAVPSVLAAEAMASAGWDALTIDMQHGTADYRDLLTLLPIIEKSGAVPLVRVPWLDAAIIMRALDAGAMGVIAPMIESAEAAEQFVHACRYPPEGGRSFGPVRARLSWPGAFSVTRANASVLALAMIETKDGVAALEDILAVPGLSGIYIGPGDLALSYGFSPAFDREEPELIEVIQYLRHRTSEAGLLCCLHCGTASYATRAAAWGMDLVTVGSDARLIEAGARAVVQDYRKAGT